VRGGARLRARLGVCARGGSQAAAEVARPEESNERNEEVS
jgi:hypothetical protein